MKQISVSFCGFLRISLMHSSIRMMQQQDRRETRVSQATVLPLARVFTHLSARESSCRALVDLILRFVTPLIPHLAFTAIHQGADVEGINCVRPGNREKCEICRIPERNLSDPIVELRRDHRYLTILKTKKSFAKENFIYF